MIPFLPMYLVFFGTLDSSINHNGIGLAVLCAYPINPKSKPLNPPTLNPEPQAEQQSFGKTEYIPDSSTAASRG